MKFLTDKDVASGLMFGLVGIFGLFLSRNMDFGATAHPGPGFFPILLSWVMLSLGLIIAMVGYFKPVGGYTAIAWRPFALITFAVVVFALLIDRLGLMPSVFLAVLTGSFAKPQFGHMPRLITAGALSVVSAVLFIWALRLPIPLWSF